jgi:hypothetical protein
LLTIIKRRSRIFKENYKTAEIVSKVYPFQLKKDIRRKFFMGSIKRG